MTCLCGNCNDISGENVSCDLQIFIGIRIVQRGRTDIGECFNLQGKGMTIKKRSRVDPALMEDIDYDADGNEVGKSYEPA